MKSKRPDIEVVLKTLSPRSRRLLGAFDASAQSWGYQRDQGCGSSVDTSHRHYDDDLRALVARIAELEKQPTVMVRIEGGIIQSVFADRNMRCLIIDYDTDGAEPAELTAIPQDDGSTSDAFFTEEGVTVMRREIKRLLKVYGT